MLVNSQHFDRISSHSSQPIVHQVHHCFAKLCLALRKPQYQNLMFTVQWLRKAFLGVVHWFNFWEPDLAQNINKISNQLDSEISRRLTANRGKISHSITKNKGARNDDAVRHVCCQSFSVESGNICTKPKISFHRIKSNF